MTDKKRYIAGTVLAVVYAFFFASTNFFYHSHIISDIKIVHSHPWSGTAHSHSSDQLTLIEVIDSAVYEDSETVSVDVPIPESFCLTEALALAKSPCSTIICNFSLRAPPTHCYL